MSRSKPSSSISSAAFVSAGASSALSALSAVFYCLCLSRYNGLLSHGSLCYGLFCLRCGSSCHGLLFSALGAVVIGGSCLTGRLDLCFLSAQSEKSLFSFADDLEPDLTDLFSELFAANSESSHGLCCKKFQSYYPEDFSPHHYHHHKNHRIFQPCAALLP